MKIADAASILGISGEISPDVVKKAYRKACSIYHPDRNPAGTEMMKAVNAAYEILKDFNGTIENANPEYGEAFNEALKFVMSLHGVVAEICGNWIWLSGNTKEHKEVLKNSKNIFADGNGFRWAPQKKRWYYRPGEWKSASRGGWSMDEIRDEYGSTVKQTKGRVLLRA